MIKSYKIILIIQFFVLIVFGFIFYAVEYGNNFAIIPAVPLLLIGFSPFILLGISILIQRLIVAIISSDSAIDDSEKNNEDKFWYNSFLANLIFSAIVFLFSFVSVILSFRIGIKGYYGFGIRFCVFLGVLYLASLLIALFLRIKDSVNEVSKLLGGLMLFISILIFGGSLFLGLQNLITLQYSSNEVVEALKTVPEVDETQVSIDSTALVEDNFAVDSLAARDMERLEPIDYYGIKDFSYPEIEKEVYFKGIFNDYNWDETENLLRGFLADFLRLEKGQSFMEIRRALFSGLTYKEYPGIITKIKEVRNNRKDLEETFDNYKPLIYAFVSEKIYYDSNLNLFVDALIKSYDDINDADTDEDSFDKIHQIMVTGTKKEFPGYYFERLKPYVSKQTLALIKKNANENEENEYSTQLTTVWIYSFWARRNKERNIGVTYDILVKIKEHYERKENE